MISTPRIAGFILLASLPCAVACDEKPAPASASSATAPAAGSAAPTTGTAPPPSAAAAGSASDPAWYAKAPKRGGEVKAGDRAWGFYPLSVSSAPPAMTIVEVMGVEGDRVEVRAAGTGVAANIAWKTVEGSGTKFKVPAGFVHPAHKVSEVKPKVGDILVAKPTGGMLPAIIRVKAVEGDLVSYDAPTALGDKTEEVKTDYAEPIGKDLAPFSLASCKVAADKEVLTIVVDNDGTTVFGVSRVPEYQVVSVPKADCKALVPVTKTWKEGDTVLGFPYGSKSADGEIKKVVLAGWVYQVGYAQATWDQVFAK